MRQPNLYAEMMWRRQRAWSFMLMGLGVVLAAWFYFQSHDRFTQQSAVFLAYIPAGLFFLTLLLIYRRRNYVQAAEDGLRVSRLFSTVVIGYDQIRQVRVQSLEANFQDKRQRLLVGTDKDLLKRPALFLRLRSDDARVEEIRRRLGAKLCSPEYVAIPIPDPDKMSWEITSRLPERVATNQGGQRRRRRRR